MIDRDKVFDAFRNCITEPKCRDCPWEQCEQFNQKKTEIPITLALDVIELLKERGQKNGKWIPCKSSIHPYGFNVKCSECGLQMGRAFGYHYCPKCGAKMEGR